MKPFFLVLLLCGALTTGCGGDMLARDAGRQLFSDTNLSTSTFNAFSCATCHQIGSSPPAPTWAGPHTGRIDPGYDLFDVVHRPSWWGRYATALLDSINYCLTEFMGGRALRPDDIQARELYEYLNQTSADNPASALSLTVVRPANARAVVVEKIRHVSSTTLEE